MHNRVSWGLHGGMCMQVGPRPVWKDQQHPLRNHPQLQLTGIPTLVHWKDSAPSDKLGPELESAISTQEADKLIQLFVAQHSMSNGAPAGKMDSRDAGVVQTLMQQLETASERTSSQQLASMPCAAE